jgi:hypothetical protein
MLLMRKMVSKIHRPSDSLVDVCWLQEPGMEFTGQDQKH